MKKVLDFGKVDYNGSGRKNCRITIEVSLKETDKGLAFSASGNVWNPRETDIYTGGQCIDELAKFFPKNKKMQSIKRVWEEYHLNDMKAGTPKQQQFIKEWKKTNKYDYDNVCSALKEVDLYIDNGYRYGTAWLFEELPQNIIDEIKRW